MTMTDRIKQITGEVTFADDQTVQFIITRDGVTRWGNTTGVLGRAVFPTEAMATAVSTESLWEEEPDPESIDMAEAIRGAVMVLAEYTKRDPLQSQSEHYAALAPYLAGALDQLVKGLS